MKRRTALTTTILLLLLGLMIWSFGSSAADTINNRRNDATATARNEVVQQNNSEDVDADLGKRISRINREEYLRLRDEYIARKRGIEPGLPFNPRVRVDAIQQMERQEKGRLLESLVAGNSATSADAGSAWTPIGPSPLPNGVGSSATSGRVTSIAIDPTNSNKVYLGTAQGGVWRSLDGGTNWTAIFDGANSLAIGALAVAPSNPSILYVGTGEFNACGDCFFGAGLYRIDNVDTSPSLVGPINTQVTGLTYNAFEGRSITKILVHPTDPATIWVSTARGVSGSGANGKGTIPPVAQRGVFKSTNAWPTSTGTNVTFQKLTLPGITDTDTTDMVMEPGIPDNILVAANGSPSSIYRTTNATAASPTFTQTAAAADGTPLGLGNGNRVNLAINKIGSAVTVYAATSET